MFITIKYILTMINPWQKKCIKHLCGETDSNLQSVELIRITAAQTYNYHTMSYTVACKLVYG